ncbi:c-type cytochrome [Oscillatoria amoena NRMC-F 0135]|nr:c-type cytochrome [Oscillatoria amoena NRMC-F 0135]
MNLRTLIKKLTSALTVLLAVVLFAPSAYAEPNVEAGKKLFEENCTSCHYFGKNGQGPALSGVTGRRQEAWLKQWIKQADKMIAAGDPIATQLAKDYAPNVMTNFESLTDVQIGDIIAYLKTNPTDAGAEPTPVVGEKKVVSPESGDAEATSSVKSLINFLIVLILIAVLIIMGAVFNVLGLISRYTGIPFSNPHKVNAWLMIVFMVVGLGATFWEFKVHGKYALIDNAASEHGASVDSMLMTTLYITGFVFVVTQIALFVFAFLYRHKPGRKALFYPHNNMLEYIWTIIPAIALTVLVINGFTKWSAITKKAPENAETVEVFAYQFGWNVRYAGADNKLGEFSFNLISGTNPLGLGVEDQYTKLKAEVDTNLRKNEDLYKRMQTIPDPTSEEKEEMAGLVQKIRLQKAHLSRLAALEGDKRMFNKTADDDLVLKEIVLVKNKPIHFVFRARDVIHSAYSPHFRMQMNCVPGMPTTFWFTPTKTTAEMRGILEDPKFDYYLYCAKICGAAHYNMKIKIRVVETEAEYQKWIAEQKPAFAPATEAVPASTPAPADTDTTKTQVMAQVTK